MADEHTITIRAIEPLTHDVRRYRCDKPAGYEFEPGQATDVRLDQDGWRDETRPFTFTSLPEHDHLEFTIKSYPDHDGVTAQIGMADVGDRLIIGGAWGAITDQGAGTFIAGGAGVTPFIAILRDRLVRDDLDGCHLIFSNLTERDIIMRTEFEGMVGLRTTFLVTDEPDSPLAADLLDKTSLDRLIDDVDQQFYVCGPPPMIDAVTSALQSLGVDGARITVEDLD
jgi:ferredoxin-NADP reductase